MTRLVSILAFLMLALMLLGGLSVAAVDMVGELVEVQERNAQLVARLEALEAELAQVTAERDQGQLVIERLLAENETLVAQHDQLQADAARLAVELNAAVAGRQVAQAEAQRLRAVWLQNLDQVCLEHGYSRAADPGDPQGMEAHLASFATPVTALAGLTGVLIANGFSAFLQSWRNQRSPK